MNRTSPTGPARTGDHPGAPDASPDPGAEGAPGSAAQPDGPQRLVVLYDAGCPLCRWARDWLERQDPLVPLLLVPLGSEQAWRLFPGLDHARTAREVTVVSDRGDVWTADAAWIMCLWATRRYRPLALRLAEPAWRPRARSVVLAVAAATSRTPRPEDCDPSGACRRPQG